MRSVCASKYTIVNLPPADWYQRLHSPCFVSFMRHANSTPHGRNLWSYLRGKRAQQTWQLVSLFGLATAGSWVLIESSLGFFVF